MASEEGVNKMLDEMAEAIKYAGPRRNLWEVRAVDEDNFSYTPHQCYDEQEARSVFDSDLGEQLGYSLELYRGGKLVEEE